MFRRAANAFMLRYSDMKIAPSTFVAFFGASEIRKREGG
jgi:hypothetical protein